MKEDRQKHVVSYISDLEVIKEDGIREAKQKSKSR